jgi:two-component system cell cycle response regulator DivK
MTAAALNTAAMQTSSADARVKNRRILVVEDQEDNRRILRDLLTSRGYDLVEAEDGEKALTLAEDRRPDLILMDVQIPPQSQSGAARHSDHRRHLLCPERRREQGAGRRLQCLRQQAVQRASAPGKDPGISPLADPPSSSTCWLADISLFEKPGIEASSPHTAFFERGRVPWRLVTLIREPVQAKRRETTPFPHMWSISSFRRRCAGVAQSARVNNDNE